MYAKEGGHSQPNIKNCTRIADFFQIKWHVFNVTPDFSYCECDQREVLCPAVDPGVGGGRSLYQTNKNCFIFSFCCSIYFMFFLRIFASEITHCECNQRKVL